MGLTSAPLGINLSVRMRIVWRRGKANINRLLGVPLGICAVHESTCRFPYEIVEVIIAHIARDAHNLRTLKACSLTCHSWYIAAVPHLHHTLTLTHRKLRLKPLSKLHRLGLMPLIKELRVNQWDNIWFVSKNLSRRDLAYFSALTNVHTLSSQYLDISFFMPDIERYFGHFLPTLRSIALFQPRCTPQQLSHFFSLFPNLDDINICFFSAEVTAPDAGLVPFSTPRLRGRLVVHQFDSVEVWTCLVASSGGLRFRNVDLYRVRGCAPVLFEACAKTLETLRFNATDGPGGE
jgi:hypothetical protein